MGNYWSALAELAAPRRGAEKQEDFSGGPTRPGDAAQARRLLCKDPWLKSLEEGKKTAEGFAMDPTWEGVAPGSELVFVDLENPERTVRVEVIGVKLYSGPDAVRQFLEGETIDRVYPGAESLEAAEALCLESGITGEAVLGLSLRPWAAAGLPAGD